jgi:hypothetical protein
VSVEFYNGSDGPAIHVVHVPAATQLGLFDAGPTYGEVARISDLSMSLSRTRLLECALHPDERVFSASSSVTRAPMPERGSLC